MFDIQTMMPIQKPPTSARNQEKAARQLSGQFLELMLKPMLANQHGSFFGGDSWMGDSAVSHNIIQPMLIQHMSSILANQGNAMGLYPLFLKAIKRIEKQREGGAS